MEAEAQGCTEAAAAVDTDSQVEEEASEEVDTEAAAEAVYTDSQVEEEVDTEAAATVDTEPGAVDMD